MPVSWPCPTAQRVRNLVFCASWKGRKASNTGDHQQWPSLHPQAKRSVLWSRTPLDEHPCHRSRGKRSYYWKLLWKDIQVFDRYLTDINHVTSPKHLCLLFKEGDSCFITPFSWLNLQWFPIVLRKQLKLLNTTKAHPDLAPVTFTAPHTVSRVMDLPLSLPSVLTLFTSWPVPSALQYFLPHSLPSGYSYSVSFFLGQASPACVKPLPFCSVSPSV